MSTAPPFPRRFEFRYSVDEALRRYDGTSRRQAPLVGSGPSWVRIIMLMFLVSGLAFLAQAQGSITQKAVPFIATLLSLAFIIGAYSAWMEAGSTAKRNVRALNSGSAFGPWHVIISDDTIEADTGVYSVRLNLASVQDVVIDDIFVVMIVDPTLDFALPKRCLGDDTSAEAFKRFVESRRTGAEPRAPRL